MAYYNNSSICVTTNNNSEFNMSKGCSNSDFKYYYEYKEFRVYELVKEYTPYVVHCPSVLFNLLCIIVVSRMKPFNSACIFMFVLGLTDLVCVISRIMYTYVDLASNDWVCRLLTYIALCSMVYSNFVLVCFTLERIIVTKFPLKASQICTNKNTYISLSVTLIVCLALNLPYITDSYITDVLRNGIIIAVCTKTDFLGNKWTKALGIYHNIVPIGIIALSNAVIIYNLKKRNRKKLEMMSRQRVKDQKSPTKTLIVVSIVFLLLHLPHVLFNIFVPDFPTTPEELPFFDQHLMAVLLLIGTILYSLMTCQNGVNFFLYCLTAANFRRIVWNAISKLITHLSKRRTATSTDIHDSIVLSSTTLSTVKLTETSN